MSKLGFVFHDGRNYRIVMNYSYKSSAGTMTDIRGYKSLQTVSTTPTGTIGRPYTNGNFDTSKWLTSNIVKYNGQPDYWTSNWDPSVDSKVLVRKVLSSEDKKTDHDILLGWWSQSDPNKNHGGSIYQDCYADRYGYIINPSTNYQLNFWAKGSPGQARATIQFFWGTSSSSPVYTRNIDSTSWKYYTLTVPSPSTSQIIYARIYFIADPGCYAYISTTDFGIPGGVT